jgi:hypothetical protein
MIVSKKPWLLSLSAVGQYEQISINNAVRKAHRILHNTSLSRETETVAFRQDDHLKPGVPMQIIIRTLAISVGITSAGAVCAESTEEKQISSLATKNEDNWLSGIDFSALVEIEAQRVSPDNEKPDSNTYDATIELGFQTQLNAWISAKFILFYENSDDESGETSIDTATITLSDPDSFWFVTAGQYNLPFGDYSSNLISDPITVDAGETSGVLIETGIDMVGIHASLYVFNGEQESDVSNGGVSLGYRFERDDVTITTSLGWINDMGESDFVIDDETEQTNMASAWTAFAQIELESMTFIGEYVAATQALEAYSTTDKPSAFNLEAAYHFDLLNKPTTLAIGVQGSAETSNLAKGLDKKRIIAGASVEIFKGGSIAVEYTKSEEYDGVESDIITGQLAVEF